MEKYILASASPRRRELMALITPDFEIIPADVEEILPEDIYPEESSEYLAELKCRHVSAAYPDRTVIGCDTTVLIDRVILGKPRDAEDAFDMLKRLSGKTHLVITGVCICRGDKMRKFSQISEVEFYELSDDEINEYIATGEPFDKAGAYGIQGYGGMLVKSIRGDYNNIVGLPAARLKRELIEFNKE
ncbi:MAG: Maf family protein [Oscillospiraceae bacterium]